MNFEQACRCFQSQMQMFSSFSEPDLQEIYLSGITMLNMLLPCIAGSMSFATLRVGEAYLTCHTKEDNRTHRCVWDFPSLTGFTDGQRMTLKHSGRGTKKGGDGTQTSM